MTSAVPPHLPRHKGDISRIIDQAFVKFERHLHECLSEAEDRIIAEATTAQEYCMSQLSTLKDSIMGCLQDHKELSGTVKAINPLTGTGTRKRARPVEDKQTFSLPTEVRKRTRYSTIGIAEARAEIAAEVEEMRQKLAPEMSATKAQISARSAGKKQSVADKRVNKGQRTAQWWREEVEKDGGPRSKGIKHLKPSEVSTSDSGDSSEGGKMNCQRNCQKGV